MSDDNIMKLEIDYDGCQIRFLNENEEVGVIRFRTNSFHNRNYYLEADFVGVNINNARMIFEEIAQKLDKPLQVMISSDEEGIITLLEAAGFVCKRKCYEVEAGKQDYIGGNSDGEILYSFAGDEVYKQCCELMMARYILTHKEVSPWTGSKEEFFKELPECVAYFSVGEKLSCFAFLEGEEIAYVYGECTQEFRIFAQVLVMEMLKQHKVIVFEADDCDEIAMELKSLFTNQEEDSFDTYIMQKKEL